MTDTNKKNKHIIVKSRHSSICPESNIIKFYKKKLISIKKQNFKRGPFLMDVRSEEVKPKP